MSISEAVEEAEGRVIISKDMGFLPGVRGFKSGKYGAARTGIRGKGTGAAQLPVESVSEQLARKQ